MSLGMRTEICISAYIALIVAKVTVKQEFLYARHNCAKRSTP